MKKTLLLLGMIAASAFAQKALFTQPVGNDTFRIKGDACLWARGWYLEENDTTKQSTFGRAYGFVGVTVQYGKYAYARYYYDLGEINGKPDYDLYAGVNWKKLDFRFGQLKMPLGYEVITAPWKMDFIENSQLIENRTPTTLTRDIGAYLAYNYKYLQPTISVVNGNGRNNTMDNNLFKDVEFRLPITPLGNPNLTVAANGYLGNDTFASTGHPRPFTRLGAEVLWSQPKYFIRGEYLTGHDSTGPDSTAAYRTLSGFYVAGGYRAGMWQPVLRVERLTENGVNTGAITVGVNAFFVSDMFKPMLDITLSNNSETKATTAKVMAQIQAAFW
jgi:hypothetical protein